MIRMSNEYLLINSIIDYFRKEDSVSKSFYTLIDIRRPRIFIHKRYFRAFYHSYDASC